MINANLENPVQVKMDDALQLTMFAAGVIHLLRTDHPALDSDYEAELAKLAVLDLLSNIPDLMGRVSIDDCEDEIKCPVTGQILKAPDGDGIDFRASDAFVGEVDDVELDCALFKDEEIARAWEEFIAQPPPYESYPELLTFFVAYNYHLFQHMDLLLVTSESDATRTTSYALLNQAFGSGE